VDNSHTLCSAIILLRLDVGSVLRIQSTAVLTPVPSKAEIGKILNGRMFDVEEDEDEDEEEEEDDDVVVVVCVGMMLLRCLAISSMDIAPLTSCLFARINIGASLRSLSTNIF